MKLPFKFNTKDSVTVFLVAFMLLAIPLTVITIINQRDERGNAAGVGSIRLIPATGSVLVNNNITFDIRENSGTELVNAFQVQLTYDPTKFDFISIDKAGSAFPDGDSTRNIGAGGVVYTFGLVQTPVTGDQFVAKVTLRAKGASGPTPINFVTVGTDGTYVIRAADATDILGTTSGATITIVDPLPTVNITSPTNGALVNGIITVNAAATDNLGVSKVDFSVDTGQTYTDITPNVGTNTYSFPLNTATLPNTNHIIRAVATDISNGVSIPSQITVTVDNSLPVVTITAPVNGQKYSKTVPVTVTATDNRAITRVDFYVDGSFTPKFSTTTSPLIYNWDTTLETDTTHTLTAKASDGLNTSVLAEVTVIVDNQKPTIPVLTATPFSSTQINLSWTASTDTQSSVTYDVYRDGSKINNSSLTTTSFPDIGLVGGNTYTYFIRAKDGIGNSSDSNPVSATTPGPPIVGDLNGDGKVNIFDASMLFFNWNSKTIPAYDLNHNGVVDIFDASMLFFNWTG